MNKPIMVFFEDLKHDYNYNAENNTLEISKYISLEEFRDKLKHSEITTIEVEGEKLVFNVKTDMRF